MKLKKPEQTSLDKVIAKYAPAWGAKRARARLDMVMTSAAGGFVGARKDRRAMKDWSPTAGSADADLLYDLPTLRERSEDLTRNAPLATGAIKTMVTNVVGTGLVAKARINRELLKLSDEQADAWEARAEWLFRLWALGAQGADITREMSFGDVQQLVLRAKLVRGDVLLIRRYSEEDGGLIGFRWQVVEADRVSNPKGRSNSATLRDGVEKDTQGRVAGYHVQRTHPGDLTVGAAAREWDFVPAWSNDGTRQAILVYGIERPEQSRGVPILAPVMESFKQLDQYREGELMAAVLSSMATFFIKSDTGESMPGSPGAGTSGDPADTENELKLGYGAFIGLADGEDIVNPNPGRPNEAFEPFVTAILQQVGAALELPMSLLIKMFKASYSASRGELLEAWKAFKAQRFSLVQDLCAPTWEAALSEYVARGLLAAPGFFEDAEIRAAWLQHEWIGPSAGSLDPEKEVNAAEKAINANLSTRDRETAALNGGDWITDQGQRAKEAKRIKADGTGTPAPAAAAPAEGTGQPDPKPGSDQEQEESN